MYIPWLSCFDIILAISFTNELYLVSANIATAADTLAVNSLSLFMQVSAYDRAA